MNDVDNLIACADANISALQRSRALTLDLLCDADAAAQEHAHLGTSSALPLRDAFTIADCERMAGIVVIAPDIICPAEDDDPYRNWPMNWDTTAERNGDR